MSADTLIALDGAAIANELMVNCRKSLRDGPLRRALELIGRRPVDPVTGRENRGTRDGEPQLED